MMTPASAIAFATSNSGYLFFTECSLSGVEIVGNALCGQKCGRFDRSLTASAEFSLQFNCLLSSAFKYSASSGAI